MLDGPCFLKMHDDRWLLTEMLETDHCPSNKFPGRQAQLKYTQVSIGQTAKRQLGRETETDAPRAETVEVFLDGGGVREPHSRS